MTVTINGTTGIVNNATDLNYTGTLTGGTGVVNLGSGQVYKDASGNVGIGTSSPTHKLDVNGNINITNSNSNRIAFSAGDTFTPSGGNVTAAYGMTVGGFVTNSISLSGYNGIAFYSANTERARINSSGQLLVGTTSATGNGSFTGSSNVSTFNWAGITLTQYGVVAGFYYDRLNFTNAQYFVVNSGGTGVYLGNGSTSWSAYSDIRLKNVTGTYTNALADIAKLEPIKFTWKSDESAKPCVGLSAQSVQQVVPEAVDSVRLPDGDDTEYLSVRYQEVIPLLTAAIKELKAEVDALKAQLGAQA